MARLLTAPLRMKPWRPRHLRLILANVLRRGQPERDHHAHLAATLGWLCRAQDVRDCQTDAGGVSAGWSFEDGWLPSYPETTGYIIESFIAASSCLGRADLLHRAHRMVDWELSIQSRDGSFPGHFGEPGSRPVIFNTGQIMHGMLAGYLHLARKECLAAAVRAGHWLVSQQDPDGCWTRSEYLDAPHVYNTRAAWALLRAGVLSEEAQLAAAAIKNLDWALAQETASGWFAANGFAATHLPYTHTIAYAIRGFLEVGLILGVDRYIKAASKASEMLARRQRADGWLAATFDDAWRPRASYCCLTGLAQMSVNWMRLAQTCGRSELRHHARLAIAFLKRTQRIGDSDPAVEGGIAGSSPIWGRYSAFEYPNWAAKFFADALMMDLWDIAIPNPVLVSAREETAHV